MFLCSRCSFLHRTAGDTERRYHLRYYKTGSCIHETDAKGHCTKNGSHCAFAHGSHDLRSPVYDIRCAGLDFFYLYVQLHTHASPIAQSVFGMCFPQRDAGDGVSRGIGSSRGKRGGRAVGTSSEHSPHREDPERRTTLAR